MAQEAQASPAARNMRDLIKMHLAATPLSKLVACAVGLSSAKVGAGRRIFHFDVPNELAKTAASAAAASTREELVCVI